MMAARESLGCWWWIFVEMFCMMSLTGKNDDADDDGDNDDINCDADSRLINMMTIM